MGGGGGGGGIFVEHLFGVAVKINKLINRQKKAGVKILLFA